MLGMGGRNDDEGMPSLMDMLVPQFHVPKALREISDENVLEELSSTFLSDTEHGTPKSCESRTDQLQHSDDAPKHKNPKVYTPDGYCRRQNNDENNFCYYGIKLRDDDAPLSLNHLVGIIAPLVKNKDEYTSVSNPNGFVDVVTSEVIKQDHEKLSEVDSSLGQADTENIKQKINQEPCQSGIHESGIKSSTPFNKSKQIARQSSSAANSSPHIDTTFCSADNQSTNLTAKQSKPNKISPVKWIGGTSKSNETPVSTQEPKYKVENTKNTDLNSAVCLTKKRSDDDKMKINSKPGLEGLPEPESVGDQEQAIESKKSYKVPFVSSNPEENEDNENVMWDDLRNLATDLARYQSVREYWKSDVVPNPNVNHTTFSVLHQKHRDLTSEYHSKTSGKRKLNDAEAEIGQQPKKMQKLSNVEFSVYNIRKAEDAVVRSYNNLRARKRNQKTHKEYAEKLYQLRLAESEVKTFHNFYMGLPNQNSSVSQFEAEDEMKDIRHTYERYKHLYHWDGRTSFWDY